MRVFILAFLLICSIKGISQTYILPNEQNVFSFHTTNGKKVVIAKDTSDKYLVYRFGSSNKIEFEFPNDKKNSWNKFEYSFLLRGGGKQNEGMDLNYLQFTNEGFKYVIYSTYFSANNQSKVGVRVVQLSNEKTIDIKGSVNSRRGSLVDFRDNELVGQSEEIFD